jgi:hypothetical protein
VSRWAAFTELCGHLRAGFLAGVPPRRRRFVSWERVIEASSHHCVTPALAWSVKDRTDVPAPIRDYLDTILALNDKRNQALLAALARIVAACNAIGIEPVPLKGAARLVERVYPSTSLRFLGDLDVLIPAQRAADVVAALRASGFHPDENDQPPLPSHHHLQMLHDRARGGGVELHTGVVTASSAAIIATDWFLAGTRPCAFQDLRIRLPDATRSIGHIVAHDQLDHEGYRLQRFDLRQVLDLAVIRARQEASNEGAIDWAELDQRFCRRERGEVLATYLAITEALLGQPAPRLSRAPRSGRELRRIVAPARSQHLGSVPRRLAALTGGYLTLVRRDPLGVLRLLDWRKWPGRIRLVMTAFDRNPPGGKRP